MGTTDHHPNDAIYGTNPDPIESGRIQRVLEDDMVPRRSYCRQIDVKPRRSVYRVTPAGDWVFLCKAGEKPIKNMTVQMWDGDELKFKKYPDKR